MTTDDRDDRIDDLLRDTMRAEAESIVPAGDGLSRIQQRVAARRSRMRWMRPALALGSAALVGLAGVGAFALTNGDSRDSVGIVPGTTPPVSETSSPSASPSPSTEPVGLGKFPQLAIFPFTTAAQEQTWETGYPDGHQPWVADPTAVAQMWVNNLLGLQDVDEVVQTQIAADGATADVTLGRTMTAEQRRQVPVTVVHLVKYGKGWIVTGADDPQQLLLIWTPDAGAAAGSPLAVTGPAFGVDEAAHIAVRDATQPAELGADTVSFGEGMPHWTANISFAPPASAVGVLVATERSLADGGTSRITAEQIRFSTGSVAAAPQYFYGIKYGRVTKFSSRNGAAVDYLTDPQPGGGASDPQLSADGRLVYFLRGGGTCVNSLMSVSTASSDNTQPENSVATPDDGYVISGYDVLAAADGGDPAVAMYETACDPSSDPQARLVMQRWNGDRSTVDFASPPPGIESDPVWEDNDRHVDAFVRTGTQGYVARYDARSSGGSSTPGAACPIRNDALPRAIDWAEAGIWTAAQTGSSIQVSVCSGGTWSERFAISSNRTPSDIAVALTGTGVLVTDTEGHVWRWDGSGTARQLSPAVPLDHVTW